MKAAKSVSKAHRHLSSGLSTFPQRFASTQIQADYAVLGGGPVGGSTAWQLAEKLLEAGEEKKVVMVHDPVRRGAYEDYSRLARLSFDSHSKEMDVSRKAIEMLDMVDEVQSYNSGAPVIPMRPGMLFVATKGTPLAKALEHGETHGDSQFRRHSPAELDELYPGNKFNLPEDTLCWSHPVGYCVDPIQISVSLQQMCKSYGVEVVEGWAKLNMSEDGGDFVLSTDDATVRTKNCFLMPGARALEIVEDAVDRGKDGNEAFKHNHKLEMQDLNTNYITAISTVRYRHANYPLDLKYDASQTRDVMEAKESEEGQINQVIPPIVLGQIVCPDLISYTANFSIVAEEMGDVYKVRLSGQAGSEVVSRVGEMYAEVSDDQNASMQNDYQNFFGKLFPYLDTRKALDFNRCITYRNHNMKFNGYSLLRKQIDDDKTIVTTPGCWGVGVKFGPILGELAADEALGNEKVLEATMMHDDGVQEELTSEEKAKREETKDVY